MKKPLISIIIVNYKTPQLTVECIKSIFQFTKDVNFEVILVENGSHDNSKEFFEKNLFHLKDKLKIIYSPHNLWFGGGNNLWCKYSQGDYLFFLNSDTLLYEDSVTLLHREYLSLSKEIPLGILGPRLFNDLEKNKVQIVGTQSPSLLKVIIATFPLIKNIFKKEYEKFVKLKTRDRNSSSIIGTICGAAIFVESKTRQKIGGFDEQFFLYMEEFDIGMRCQRLWLVNYYTIKTSIIHLENQSPKITRKKLLYSLSSLLKFILKYEFKNRGN